MNDIQIRPATSADAPGICRLFSKAFGREMSLSEWSWKYESNPDGWFGIVAEAGGRIVGNYAGAGCRFLLDGESRLLYAVGDVSTDPSIRRLGVGSGVFRRMTDAFYDAVFRNGVPFCFGFPGERHLEISHRLVGSRTLLPIREIRVPCAAFPAPPPDVVTGDSVGEPFDRFWQDASRVLTDAAVRDRPRANWRFHARPDRYYRMVWRESHGRLLGWAVLSVHGEQALVSDFLGLLPDGSDLLPLFSAAAGEAVRMGVRDLVFWETPGGPACPVLRNLPGERRDAGFPLIVRASDDAAADRLARRAHLTPALYDLV
ncbi:MAG: GNAT family N-acetyltransferase [Thermoanaerobaculia bacterium]